MICIGNRENITFIPDFSHVKWAVQIMIPSNWFVEVYAKSTLSLT